MPLPFSFVWQRMCGDACSRALVKVGMSPAALSEIDASRVWFHFLLLTTSGLIQVSRLLRVFYDTFATIFISLSPRERHRKRQTERERDTKWDRERERVTHKSDLGGHVQLGGWIAWHHVSASKASVLGHAHRLAFLLVITQTGNYF